MNLTVEVEGVQELIDKLASVSSRRHMRDIMSNATSIIKDYIAVYPPKTIANSPSNPAGRWYERGYGPRWRRADGSIGGMKTSETLSERWADPKNTRISPDGKRGVVGNNASYARWVQADDYQAGFHGRRGWRTDKETVKEKTPAIVKLFREAIRRILNR